MKYNPDTYLEQVALNHLGFNAGIEDGLRGSKTKKARANWEASRAPKKNTSKSGPVEGYPPRPHPTTSEINKVFGKYGVKGGRSPKMAYFKPPYPMVFSWGGLVSRIGCHHLIEKPLYNALKELYDTYGMPKLREWGMNIYAGCYNPRRTRGGGAGSISRHSWAIAVDFNPDENGNKTPWKNGKQGVEGWATMPKEVIDIFAKHGFRCGFAIAGGKRRDMMHFQYTL